MLEAKRLSENWTVGREVKLLGQLYNCLGNPSAKGIIICSIHASQTEFFISFMTFQIILKSAGFVKRQQPLMVRCDCR